MNSALLFLLLISSGIQSEGGHITQVDISYSHDIYLTGNLIDVIQIDGRTLFITTEIPEHLQNPFIKEGFLYYEVI